MCTGTAAMENHLAVPQNAKHKVTEWPSNSSRGDMPKNNENVCPHQNWYINDHSGILPNSQKEETTQVSTSWWTDTVGTVCAIHMIWNRKDEIQKRPWSHDAKWKEPVPKDQRKHPEEANTWWDEISGCLGLTAKGYKVSFKGDQKVCDSVVETAGQLQERCKATGPCHLNR